MLVKAAETLPEGAYPLVHSDRGCHCRWPGWLDLMERYGLTRSTREGLFAGQRRRGGVLRAYENGVRPSRGHWEERTRDEVLIPVDDCIRWYNQPRAHQAVARLDKSGTIPSKPGNGCVLSPRKRPQPLTRSKSADVKTLQAQLGHASATITLDTYAALWPERLDDVADAIEVLRGSVLEG